jgi:FkbM family methyltransferase
VQVVAAVELLVASLDARGWRAHIDAPTAGSPCDAGPGAFRGWCATFDGAEHLVSVIADERVIARTPLDAFRPDVGAAVDGAGDRTGISFDLAIDSIAAEWIDLRIDDVDLARIHLAEAGSAAAQNGEDLVLDRLVREHAASEPRWIIDIGAHDGVTLSNSRRFIEQGWDGVLVEPSPAPFAALAASHAGNPRARCVNAACSDHDGTATLFLGSDGDEGMNATLSTDTNEWFAQVRSDRSINVPAITLTSLCAAHGVPSTFAALLVDAEGMDLDVLRGLDPTRHRPTIVCTERYLHRPDKEAAKAELLRSWGMVHRSAVGWNDIWVRSEQGER